MNSILFQVSLSKKPNLWASCWPLTCWLKCIFVWVPYTVWTMITETREDTSPHSSGHFVLKRQILVVLYRCINSLSSTLNLSSSERGRSAVWLLFFCIVFLQEDKLDVSTPKMYSSFIPNGRAESHLHTPGHQGLQLGDPELSLSQVGQLMMVCSLDWVMIKYC